MNLVSSGLKQIKVNIKLVGQESNGTIRNDENNIEIPTLISFSFKCKESNSRGWF